MSKQTNCDLCRAQDIGGIWRFKLECVNGFNIGREHEYEICKPCADKVVMFMINRKGGKTRNVK